MRVKFWIVLFLLMFVSCKKSEFAADMYAPAEATMTDGVVGGGEALTKEEKRAVSSEHEATQDVSSVGQQAVPSPVRMLIKTGRLAFPVKSFSTAKKEIIAVIPKFGGYISSENEDHSYGQMRCIIEIRVPSIHFDSLVETVSRSATSFDERTIFVQDVGEEFADVTARIKAKKEVELRYIAILARAKKISEILEIEQKIGEVRSEIESMQGRLNYLQSQVSFSTLTVTFYEPHSVPLAQRENFFSRILASVINGWNGLLNLTVSLAEIWPFILFLLGMIILTRRGIRKRKMKKGT